MKPQINSTFRTGLAALVVCVLAATLAFAQSGDISPLRDYHNGANYLPGTPSTTGGSASAFFNPAAWSTGDKTDLAFWWDTRDVQSNNLNDWGLSLGHSLGFAVYSQNYWLGQESQRVNDYQLGLALGGRGGSFGLAYRWSNGDTEPIGRQNAFLAGLIARPARFFTFGLSGTWATRSRANLGIFDLGIRPLGDERLTLYGDFTLRHGEKIGDGRWGAGLTIRPVRGLELGAKFREVDMVEGTDYRTTFSIGVVLGRNNFDVLPGYADSDNTNTAFLYQYNASWRPLPIGPAPFAKAPRYVAVSLENRRLTYQKNRWWDKKRVSWLALASLLDAIEADKSLDGVMLNLAGFSVRPSIAWELRKKLTELQAAGKEVIIHGDQLGMLTYYLASVADQITIDEQGYLMLPGVAMRRTYLKGTLEKVGIGFQEFRYFTYKSAAEILSRDSMSEADREQRGRVVEVLYETMRDGADQGRDLSSSQFDAVVDDDVILTPAEAQQAGLVDHVGYWSDLPKWLQERNGGRLVKGPSERYYRDYQQSVWGPLPKIAVVYAVGECAMDTGIKGRATSKYLNQLARDSSVKAVVLRADSPGGEPLPSDLLAEGVRKLKAAGKPVIVSQGDVAASGGYWISMDGTKILTTPMTITGSIGVIGGWIWDDGLGEKLGMSHDDVHRGKHADLFAGMGFPFIGGAIPTRPLDDYELDRAKSLIMQMYDEFVAGVAAGRGLDEATVRELAEGRVWMGGDAIQNGLADSFGSLPDAVALAREMAGLSPQRRVEIVEYPEPPLFAWPNFGPQFASLGNFLSPLTEPVASILQDGKGHADSWTDADPDDENDLDYEAFYLRTLVRHAGKPTLVTPPGMLPEAWMSEWQ